MALTVVARAWRRVGQGSGLSFKSPSLYCYSYPQPMGSSGCWQQGIMGFVVFFSNRQWPRVSGSALTLGGGSGGVAKPGRSEKRL